VRLHAIQNHMTELVFTSGRLYEDPYIQVELDVVFSGPGADFLRVPAFWAGDNVWKARFAPPAPGEYSYVTVCSDTSNRDLHALKGEVVASADPGDNPLLRHGRLRLAPSRRTLEHADGTPFFWLGDTWWMGLSQRLRWPEDFQILTEDRVRKGFSVIQIVAGPYPDVPAFDERGSNEAGFPLSEDLSHINPAYYDLADLRIGHLVRSGLAPCIVGCWGYYLPRMGVEAAKRFWRYLVARWGAYPVIWCIAGEALMPYYLSSTPKEDTETQLQGWTQVTAYVRQLDPFHNPITIHPTADARDQVTDMSLLDIHMLQTGHSGVSSVGPTIHQVTAAVARTPRRAVIVGEVNYEGLAGTSWEDVQRMCFWGSILNGAAGHTYGANGIWQVNTRARPFGPSPHGRTWGNTPWDEAMRLPGSTQLGLAKRFLETLPWQEMEPHPEWAEATAFWTADPGLVGSACAGIPRRLRVLYTPPTWNPPLIKGIEADVHYVAVYFDPRTGHQVPAGVVEPDADGNWRAPITPTFSDWVLVLKSEEL